MALAAVALAALLAAGRAAAQTGVCCDPAAPGCLEETLAACDARDGAVWLGEGAACSDALLLCPFVDELRVLPVVADRPLRLALGPIAQRLHRDRPLTPLWGVSGSFPGPVVETRAGEPATVMWENGLPPDGAGPLPPDECADGPTTGGAAWPRVDGGGATLPARDSGGIPPGASANRTYANAARAGASRYWDAAPRSSRLSTGAGLVGMYLALDAGERALGLPSGAAELRLVLADRTVGDDGALVYPVPWAAAFEGAHMLVNGRVWPRASLCRGGYYRARVLNACESRVLALAFRAGPSSDDAQPGAADVDLWVVGADGGLLGAPARVPGGELRIPPGGVADFVFGIGAEAAVGVPFYLVDAASAGSASWVMRLDVGDAAPDFSAPPPGALVGAPNALPPSAAALLAAASVRRHISLVPAAGGGCGEYELRVAGGAVLGAGGGDLFSRAGTVELWNVTSPAGAAVALRASGCRLVVVDGADAWRRGAWLGAVEAPALVAAVFGDDAAPGRYEVAAAALGAADHAARAALWVGRAGAAGCDGDGVCGADEDCGSCPGDCGAPGNGGECCGDGVCVGAEGAASCAVDCSPCFAVECASPPPCAPPLEPGTCSGAGVCSYARLAVGTPCGGGGGESGAVGGVFACDADGECVDVDECAGGTSGCADVGSVCTNTNGSHACECAAGFTGDGVSCVDDRLLACEDSASCAPGASCGATGDADAFACLCPPGSFGNGSVSCVSAAACPSARCSSAGVCAAVRRREPRCVCDRERTAPDCTLAAVCGNGAVDHGEGCDAPGDAGCDASSCEPRGGYACPSWPGDGPCVRARDGVVRVSPGREATVLQAGGRRLQVRLAASALAVSSEAASAAMLAAVPSGEFLVAGSVLVVLRLGAAAELGDALEVAVALGTCDNADATRVAEWNAASGAWEEPCGVQTVLPRFGDSVGEECELSVPLCRGGELGVLALRTGSGSGSFDAAAAVAIGIAVVGLVCALGAFAFCQTRPRGRGQRRTKVPQNEAGAAAASLPPLSLAPLTSSARSARAVSAAAH